MSVTGSVGEVNATGGVAGISEVDFHFDIMCPWAYQSSLWIREVRAQTGLSINWRFFSLEEINRVDGKKHPWEREWSYGWSMMRIGALLRRTDMDLLDSWYLHAGRALHEQGRKPHRREIAEELLGEMGLDPALVGEALADETTHDEVRSEHELIVGSGGFGVPTLRFADGQIIFGPVVVDAPFGDDAVRLWDHVCGWLEFPDLFEIQRPKGPNEIARIAEKFTPYLEARDWVTIQKETP